MGTDPKTPVKRINAVFLSASIIFIVPISALIGCLIYLYAG